MHISLWDATKSWAANRLRLRDRHNPPVGRMTAGLGVLLASQNRAGVRKFGSIVGYLWKKARALRKGSTSKWFRAGRCRCSV